MPPFPERESSILAKLKRKKGPGAGSALDDGRRDPSSNDINGGVEPTPSTVVSPRGWAIGAWGPPGATPSHLLLYLPAVDALTLRRPPGAAGSPSPSRTPSELGCREPPGGRLLRRPSCPAQPGAHPRGGLPQVPPARPPGCPFSVCPLTVPSSLPVPVPLSPWLPLPPASSLPLAILDSWLTLATLCRPSPITMSQPALPSLFPSSLFLSLPRPSAASLGLAACHACLLLSALGLDGPASWSRLPLRAPWLCWLTQLQLLSKGWPQGWGADLCPQGGLGDFRLLRRGS